jgi:hypothetical protein
MDEKKSVEKWMRGLEETVAIEKANGGMQLTIAHL